MKYYIFLLSFLILLFCTLIPAFKIRFSRRNDLKKCDCKEGDHKDWKNKECIASCAEHCTENDDT